MQYIAHTATEQGNEDQLLKDHLQRSQALAEGFASGTGLTKTAGLLALLHDVGKYSDKFQAYIHKAKQDPASVKRGSVDHATAGGQILLHAFDEPYLGQLVSNVLISHHNTLGIKDYLATPENSPFLDRIDKPIDDLPTIKQRFYTEVMAAPSFQILVDKVAQELQQYLENVRQEIEKVYHNEAECDEELRRVIFFTQKTLSSILIDADRTDTMAFEEGKVADCADRTTLFVTYHKKLLARLRAFGEPTTEINKLRNRLSEQCDDFAERGDGIYTLSSPTGAGKTIASLRYALHEAAKNKKRQIIYVIPYTSIIEQNAQVFRNLLNGDPDDDTNILEFHSNVAKKSDSTRDGDENDIDRLDLAESSWDSPIIVTTMVQFLNTIFAKGTKNARRFHNLLNAVLVFDEIQNLPLRTTKLFNAAINYLATYGHSDILLCTATQPSLDRLTDGIRLSKDHELIPDLTDTFEKFRRVEIINRSNKQMDADELADLLQEVYAKTHSVLAIVNTKGATRVIYDRLEDQVPGAYHLSTNMCPVHRKNVLKEIKQRLKEGKPTLCISTQLIEAGVDISFKTVVRSLTGVDSIAQAAGRCNRNGELTVGQVYLVDPMPALERLTKLPEIDRAKGVTETLLYKLDQLTDLLNPNWVQRYFERYYHEQAAYLGYPCHECPRRLDLYSMLTGSQILKESDYQQERELMWAGDAETIARHFEVIPGDTVGVLVPYQKGKDLIYDLNGTPSDLTIQNLKDLFHRAQPYLVNVYQNQLNNLLTQGIIVPLSILSTSDTMVYAVTDERYYDPKLGLISHSTDPLAVDDYIF
ncbi:CRISPR-associated helicase Cas3' [Limosilactobacillus ingluviei]|uniref:CRISPR-associated helicase Cas3' n=1 Tax=Limosilactobacillus ingluviei TaxID=148604 RepID=UPI0023F4D10C|nr:CRISPR-associated helicase Cas3' [Limosilactobacillus ingluviei]